MLEAIEACIVAAQQYGTAGTGYFIELQQRRQALVQAIEAHASAVFEGGIEMGRAQGERG